MLVHARGGIALSRDLESSGNVAWGSFEFVGAFDVAAGASERAVGGTIMPEKLHLTDEELLLVADGEISDRGGDQARQHLADCPACRVRLVEIRRAAADFARAHREDLNVPPDDAARANLKARLAALSI